MHTVRCQRHKIDTRRMALLMVLSLLFAACGVSSSSTTSSKQGLNSQEVDFMVNQTTTAVQNMTLLNDQQVLTGNCMTSKGYRFFPQIQTQPSVEVALYVPVLPSLSAVKKTGYLASVVGISAPPPPLTNRESIYMNSLPVIQQQVYVRALYGNSNKMLNMTILGNGVGDGALTGCLADARNAIYGSTRDYLITSFEPQFVGGFFYKMVVTSPQFRTVMQTWSACMLKVGFKFRSPFQAQNHFLGPKLDVKGHFISPAIYKLQVAVAVRSYMCQKKLNLANRLSNLQVPILRQVSPKFEGEILRSFSLIQTAEARGHKLISENWH